MAPQNPNPHDELKSLDLQVETVNDLAGLKPIFFRLEEIARDHPNDFQVQLAVGDMKQHLVNRSAKIKQIQETMPVSAPPPRRRRSAPPIPASPTVILNTMPAPPPPSPRLLLRRCRPQASRLASKRSAARFTAGPTAATATDATRSPGSSSDESWSYRRAASRLADGDFAALGRRTAATTQAPQAPPPPVAPSGPPTMRLPVQGPPAQKAPSACKARSRPLQGDGRSR